MYAFWGWVFLLLYGGTAVALYGLFEAAKRGNLPDLTGALAQVDQTAIIMGGGAVLVALGYVGLSFLIATFGSETVEQATETGKELKDEATSSDSSSSEGSSEESGGESE